MILEKILSIISMKTPSLILAIGIFIMFWISGTIFKIIVRRIMDEKSPHANIAKVLAGIVKNIIQQYIIKICYHQKGSYQKFMKY